MTSEITVREPWHATVKRYAVLAYGALGSALALGLLVVGVLLVGLAVPVFLASFGLVDIGDDLGTAPLIISSMLLGVTGGVCLGVASESPLGRGRRLQGFKIWEIGIGRTLAVFLVGIGLLFVYRLISSVIGDVPYPLYKGVETFRAAGTSGMIAMPLIGVPLGLLLRWVPTDRTWINRLDTSLMFAVWVLASIITLA